MDVLAPTTLLTRDHVRFEFHQAWSTSIKLTVDGHAIPVEVVRPTWTTQVLSRAEWKWRWTWPDGNQYQLVCPVDRVSFGGSYTNTREWLQRNSRTVAEGFFRGPRFWQFTQQWVWKFEEESIETRWRLGCRARRYLRDSHGHSLAVCFQRFRRTHGVLRGRLDSPRTPLLMGMLLSTLVDIPGSTM
jgi:hypothetical protein